MITKGKVKVWPNDGKAIVCNHECVSITVVKWITQSGHADCQQREVKQHATKRSEILMTKMRKRQFARCGVLLCNKPFQDAKLIFASCVKHFFHDLMIKHKSFHVQHFRCCSAMLLFVHCERMAASVSFLFLIGF